eukprot:4649088-Lingulodinium_polyedra.AAC.1
MRSNAHPTASARRNAARKHAPRAHHKAAKRAPDRIVAQFRETLRNDAVKRAFRRISAAKCATHARATRAP